MLLLLGGFRVDVISLANNNSFICFPESLRYFHLGQDLQYSENRGAGLKSSVFFLVLDVIRYGCSIRYICHRFLEYNFNQITEIPLYF